MNKSTSSLLRIPQVNQSKSIFFFTDVYNLNNYKIYTL
ncbi:protein of unknown function [Brevefilum fermentans]|uniref:Uncharacterized protein n=1 Tax=Candidatus Brevifilum fermentans TaxID=1986204 RepID=A0A1Y6K4L7_9CHLR|nr:protein of unknown function [Brevefilum fermentans]